MNLPRIIWMLWLSGLDDAPPLVKRCVESWMFFNPGWEVRVLDGNTLGRLDLDLPRFCRVPHVGVQAFSDVVRINLLDRHGGVWADASVLCAMPLDAWLPNLLRTGFFAFHAPTPDRMLASWFLASESNGRLVSRWANEANRFWNAGPRSLMGGPQYDEWLSRILSRHPRLLLLPGNALLLKKYPYFWLHYLFRAVCQSSAQIAAIWDATPKYTADLPHSLQRRGLQSPVDENFLLSWQSNVAPMYKLDWRAAHAGAGSSVLDYCLDPANWRSKRTQEGPPTPG